MRLPSRRTAHRLLCSARASVATLAERTSRNVPSSWGLVGPSLGSAKEGRDTNSVTALPQHVRHFRKAVSDCSVWAAGGTLIQGGRCPIAKAPKRRRGSSSLGHGARSETSYRAPEQAGNKDEDQDQASSSSGSREQTEREPGQSDPHQVDSVRLALLNAAMKHVKAHGWSVAALEEGARDLKLSPAAARMISEGPGGLVQHFVDGANTDSLKECQTHDLQVLDQRAALVLMLRTRLEKNIPYIGSLPQALRLQALPKHAPTAFTSLAAFVDQCWHLCGDRSMDMAWYHKRTALSAIYVATELYMLTDFSPGFANTWTFLDRRLKGMLSVPSLMDEARGSLYAAIVQAGGVASKWVGVRSSSKQ